MEGSEVKGDILYLGYYHSAFDWDNETAKVLRHNRLRRYHSQNYVNGTQCDVTGRAREAEVRFLCDEGSPDRLSRVDEPNTCTYILTVLTSRLCQHPSLRPPHSPDPQHIRCHPALSPTHYTQYMETQRSKPRDEGDQDKDGGNEDRTRAQDPSPVPTSPRVTDPNRRIQFKVIRSLQDLLQFMEELKGSPRRAKPQVSEDEEAAASPPLPHSDPSMGHKEGAEEEEEDEDEEEPMGELKEEVKTQMEKEFDSIINEVEQELQSKGMKGEFDPSGAFGLTRLMQRLHREEEEEEEGEGRKSRSVGQELTQREEGPIDINVMTSGGDEAEGQWLSEEDTKNLKEIFINVLLRAPPEVHLERRRLRTLQDNYRFVWPPPPMDPEDPDL
ncbi:protein OS-9 isoform X2 [Melopsittacus undulatus]|nr:protein OS-9 isoform X2 [Melopsittacus undulatus]